MSLLGRIRTNWRILLLVVLLLASMFFLFVPGAPITGAAADSGGSNNATAAVSNIQFGIDLAGGARISAPPHGYIATDVQVTDQNDQAIKQAITNTTTAEEEDIVTSVAYGSRSGFPSDAVEVRADVERAAFLQGLQNAGLDVQNGDIRHGVSKYTLDEIIATVDDRLGETGFGGSTVTRAQSPNEPRDRVQIESPGQTIDGLKNLLDSQGEVAIVAYYPGENGTGAQNETLLTQKDFEAGSVDTEGPRPAVPVTLTQSAAAEMTQSMQESGFAEGSLNTANACNTNDLQPGEYCLLTQVDGETVYSSPLSPDLANSFIDGSFTDSRQFIVEAPDISTAQDLLIDMRAGALPTTLDFDESTEEMVSPTLAEDFRRNSLITGLLAVLAVVLTVFARYGDPRVAVPMAATALSEVVILLGFAAAIGWAIELSHVAGFIAVIGTGVDDLIIIADEVKAQGEVTSQRVFQNRFRKAFWVIGAAAATTIIAMSPLAILDLGQLRGFAIITILGVLLGVAVSRPAYGSILRSLTTDSNRRS
ncbi:preprotein translocase subunit SecD [Salinarchaeum laminariae]|uniref:preprotein translocase subunit SecD n=1 Tax=Salinarchaeum laminariae TaxID=869888 RepID=UPI0020BF236C|nr:preprotein translocase subunit SecD [Salinarchaeum laminariae]